MFTKNNRTDVDTVEQDFAKFINRAGLSKESIIKQDIVNSISTPTLLDQDLTDHDLKTLENVSPWGYSFRVYKNITMRNIEIRNYTQLREEEDLGLIEMDLRTSLLDYIFSTYGKKNSETWLDIATNCGIIPLFIMKNRKLDVEAIDLFDQNIEKANLLAKLLNNSSIKFHTADAFDFLRKHTDNSYDIISALGLFYHLSDPVGLMTLIYQKIKRMAIIDTIVHNIDFSGWIQTISRHVKYSELDHANDTRKIIELHPTYRGLIDTMFQVGFKEVIEILPSQSLLKKFPSYIYKDNNRVMLLGFK